MLLEGGRKGHIIASAHQDILGLDLSQASLKTTVLFKKWACLIDCIYRLQMRFSKQILYCIILAVMFNSEMEKKKLAQRIIVYDGTYKKQPALSQKQFEGCLGRK